MSKNSFANPHRSILIRKSQNNEFDSIISCLKNFKTQGIYIDFLEVPNPILHNIYTSDQHELMAYLIEYYKKNILGKFYVESEEYGKKYQKLENALREISDEDTMSAEMKAVLMPFITPDDSSVISGCDSSDDEENDTSLSASASSSSEDGEHIPDDASEPGLSGEDLKKGGEVDVHHD
jgi:hypothetical protein